MTDVAEGTSSAARLMDVITASWMSQAVCVAAELGIADALADGARTVDALAAATGCDRGALARFMRALVTIDICREPVAESFALTEMGSCLRRNAPDSLRSWAIFWGRRMGPLWEHLIDGLRTGASVRRQVSTSEGFEHLQHDAAAASLFNDTMVELTRLVARDVAAACDFSRVRRVVDVGGGHGELIAAILEHAPHLTGAIFDLPHAMPGAIRLLEERRLAARCECIAGDFFESVPRGADAYILKSIIHDWNDERSRTILGNCRAAMEPGARLLLVERILPERWTSSVEHQHIARSDLTMLLGLGASERTEAQFGALLAASHLRVTHVRPVAMTFSIIEAAPIAPRS